MKKSDLKKEKAKQKQQEEDSDPSESDSGEQSVKLQNEIKMQAVQGPKRWFELDVDMDADEQIKWKYLQHHGVTFPDPYMPRSLSISYAGKEIKLTAFEEELAWYWCEAVGSQYEHHQYFRANFAKQFLQEINVRHSEANDLDLFDFSSVLKVMATEREERKNAKEEEKLRKKMIKAEMDRYYAFAIVDGTVEKVNGYQIEPPKLFRGRGIHPKAGLLKPRIQPQDITLNLAEDAPIPRCEMAGHSWGAIECKPDMTWLCSYKKSKISTSSTYKYIFLAANSRFKGQNDRKKYQKARRLKKCIDKIREDYFKKINDSDIRNKQLGTATYLIDNLALRVGNQKDKQEADTQGCCTLRVENLEVLPDDNITLDFLGKDSMRYVNTVKVHPAIWKNIALFRSNKKKNEDLFDKIDAGALNDYLKSQMDGLTAKVFRTYNASKTLQQQLNKVSLKGMTMQQKIDLYNEANRQVAILCNHQKTVGKKMVQSLNKKQQEIELQREYLEQLQKHKNSFTAKRDRIERETVTVVVEGGKSVVKKYPQTKQATVALLKKLEQKIRKQQVSLKKKNQGKEIALGTSKLNYNDPRISVAWCKKNEVKIEKIFNKNQLSKFLWAMYSDADFEF